MKKVILLTTLQMFILNILCAQSLSESLGGIKTSFEVFSDTIDLKVNDQMIVLGAEKKTYTGDSGGWGYGYQSFHFEFITMKELSVTQANNKNKNNYRLTFSDQNKLILATIIVPSYSVTKYTNSFIGDNRVFYSIDLINIPLLILDKSTRINIIKLE